MAVDRVCDARDGLPLSPGRFLGAGVSFIRYFWSLRIELKATFGMLSYLGEGL